MKKLIATLDYMLEDYEDGPEAERLKLARMILTGCPSAEKLLRLVTGGHVTGMERLVDMIANRGY